MINIWISRDGKHLFKYFGNRVCFRFCKQSNTFNECRKLEINFLASASTLRAQAA